MLTLTKPPIISSKNQIKKIIRLIIDWSGLSVYRHPQLPVGADYRKFIRQRFGKNSIRTVFDVGANRGQFCLHCHEIFEAAAIYSFEPVTEVFQTLKQETKHIRNISAHNFAFGNEKGSETIFLQEDSKVNSLHPPVNKKEGSTGKSQLVQINTIDDFCAENKIKKIDLLKIDAEGYDLHVLKGATRLLSDRKVLFVFIEVTFDENNAGNSSFTEINDFLKSFGFKPIGFYNQSIHDNSSRMNYCDALFYLQPLV